MRETQDYVKVFKSFKEKLSFTPRHVQPEGLCGGSLIAVTGHEAIAFYDWETGKFIQRIDVPLPKACYWNDEGDRVCIATKENFYVLKYNEEAVEQSFQSGAYDEVKGVAAAFELESEVTDVVRSAQWIGDCFLYVSKSSRLCYCVGGQIMTVAHLDDKMYLLGYLARESRVYLSNKQHSIFSYQLLTSILEYQTAVLRNDFEAANELLASGAIPKKEYNNISRFLESQGFKEEALQVADDPDQRFSLALQLQRLDIAHKIMADEVKPSEQDDADVLLKWKQLGDLALAQGELKLADDCGKRAHDLPGLLLLYTSLSDRESLEWLAQEAQRKGRTNVAFAAFFTLGDVDACVDLLIRAKRLPEASFFARSYRPSRMTEVLQLWKSELSAVSKRAASALADPGEHPEGFPDLAFAKEAEQWLAQTASAKEKYSEHGLCSRARCRGYRFNSDGKRRENWPGLHRPRVPMMLRYRP